MWCHADNASSGVIVALSTADGRELNRYETRSAEVTGIAIGYVGVPRAHECYHLANWLTSAHLPRFCCSSDGCLIVTEGSKGNLQKIPL